jgi:hypothetical protein
MAPQHLVGNAYAFATDENSRPGDKPHAELTLHLSAKRTLRLVPFDLAAFRFASEDHG